jgi:hypothetical protein
MCSAIHREQYATLSETRDTISCALIYTLHWNKWTNCVEQKPSV